MRHALIAALLVVVAGVAHADPVQWTLASGGNDHWYAAISSTQMVTWDAANAAAGAAGGYLATLTSAAENAFVWELVMPSVRPDLWSGYLWDPNWLFFGPWLGGYQDPYGSPNSDNWHWVTGEKWEYTNWYSGQPDHYIGVGGTEDRLNFLGGGSEWNDLDGDGNPLQTTMHGFVVEYNQEPGTGGATPELSTWALLACSGLCGVGVLLRRRRA